MLDVVIDRKLWWRGNGSIGSQLLIDNENLEGNGCGCCLGHIALAAGCSRQEISNIPYIDKFC